MFFKEIINFYLRGSLSGFLFLPWSFEWINHLNLLTWWYHIWNKVFVIVVMEAEHFLEACVVVGTAISCADSRPRSILWIFTFIYTSLLQLNIHAFLRSHENSFVKWSLFILNYEIDVFILTLTIKTWLNTKLPTMNRFFNLLLIQRINCFIIFISNGFFRQLSFRGPIDSLILKNELLKFCIVTFNFLY